HLVQERVLCGSDLSLVSTELLFCEFNGAKQVPNGQQEQRSMIRTCGCPRWGDVNGRALPSKI
ncbi:MAG TPA: hypothetical protein VF516_27085, partial [Kofleriaceae bacterium]